MFKKYKKETLLLIFTIIYQCLTYFIVKFFESNPYVLDNVIDAKIPFISYFIYFYIFWYIMMVFIPYFYIKKDKNMFYKYTLVTLIGVTISNIIFLIFPTTFTMRGDVSGSGITNFIVKTIYYFDDPILNCLPSIHCLLCFEFIFSSLFNRNIKKTESFIITFLSILVILSTLFVKEHAIYDVISSFVLVSIIWSIVSCFKLDIKFKNFYLNLFKQKG